MPWTIATLILFALPIGCALETSSRRPAPQETARVLDQPPARREADGASAAGHDAAFTRDR